MDVQPQYAREVTGKISPEHQYHCEVGSLPEALRDVVFPIKKEDLIKRTQDVSLTCRSGDIHTLAELLEPLTKEQYNSIADIIDALDHPVTMR